MCNYKVGTLECATIGLDIDLLFSRCIGSSNFKCISSFFYNMTEFMHGVRIFKGYLCEENMKKGLWVLFSVPFNQFLYGCDLDDLIVPFWLIQKLITDPLVGFVF